MKKNIKLFVGIVVIIFMPLIFFCTSCNSTEKEIPVYEGMSLSKTSRNINMSASHVPGAILEDAEHKSDDDVDDDDDEDDKLKNEIDDIVTIEVQGDSETKYYVAPNEKIIVEVHLSNPSAFEIQSFTLNGEKYANYMFKDGSTLELLLLEIDAPSESGYHDLTIDAIKYIDGTEIKDVKMSGEKSIKIGVKCNTLPEISDVKENIDTTKLDLSFKVVDKGNVIGNNPLEIYLSDGEKVVTKKTIQIGENKVSFDNLVMGKTYQYGIVTAYDEIDGNHTQEHWLLKNKFTTKKAFEFTSVVSTQDKINFEYKMLSNEAVVDAIELVDANTNEVAATTTTNEFTNLLSNHEYYVRLSFHYVISGEEIKDTTKTKIKTLSKTEPTIEIINVSSTQTSINYDLKITDVDSIITVDKIELYKGEEIVKTNTLTDEKTFEDLLSNVEYKIVVTYSYDLNDGVGVQTKTVQTVYKTLSKTEPTIEIIDVSSTQTSISYDLKIEDVDSIITVDKIELYKGEEVVKTNTITDEKVFNDLLSNVEYKIVVTYSFDLNDGAGVQTKTIQIDYPTLAEEVEINELVLLNSGVVKLGEEINFRVYFNNPLGKELKSIYVNGLKAEVVGGDRIESAIIKVIPETDGLIDFYIDRVDYDTFGKTVNQRVKSDIHVTYPIYGTLDIEFEPITHSPYEYTGEGTLLKFNNDKNYEVFKINDSTDFEKFSNDLYFVRNTSSYSSSASITSIEFGYSNYGSTTQTLEFSYQSHKTDLSKYIYTVDEFLSMTDGHYVLKNDLDLRKTSLVAPINFSGILDADGHTLRGLSNVIDTNSTQYYPMFSGNGSIYNAKIKELYVSINSTSYINFSLGNVSFINCEISGDIVVSTNVYTNISFDNSNQINLNITESNVPRVLHQDAQKRTQNSNVIFDNNMIYYILEDDSKILLNIFNCFEELDLSTDYLYVHELAIKGLTNLKSITLPNNLIKIVDDTFKDCNKLETIAIPDSVTSIGSNAFSGCSSLASITIPGSVTNIGYNVFDGCYNIEKAEIPTAAISSIPCQLKEVIITGGESIEMFSFTENSSLTSITIPDSVTSIGSYAFNYCSSLPSITIPASVTSIGSYAFTGCSSLTNVYYEGTIEDWCKIQFNNESANPMSYASNFYLQNNNEWQKVTNLVIPNTITEINNYQFSGFNNVTSITIPNSVTSIGDRAFWNCSSLTSITIHENVTSIGISAFYDCSSLTNVYYEGTIENWCNLNCSIFASSSSSNSNHFYIRNSNNEWEEVTSIEIPNTITEIGANQFCRFNNVTSITIPASVTSIGNGAFCLCDSLTNVIIGNSVTSIRQSAFEYCYNIETVYFEGTSTQWKEITIGLYNGCLTNANIIFKES